MTTNTKSQWATPAEAAAILAVSVKTVRRLLRRGELSGRKIGQSWRIPRRALCPSDDDTPTQQAAAAV